MKENLKLNRTSHPTQKKNSMEGEKVYSGFVRDRNAKTDTEDQLLWMSRSDLKTETEVLTCTAQDQTLRTNYER